MRFQNPLGRGIGRGRGYGRKRAMGSIGIIGPVPTGGTRSFQPIPPGAVRTLRSKGGARASARIRRARAAIRRKQW